MLDEVCQVPRILPISVCVGVYYKGVCSLGHGGPRRTAIAVRLVKESG